jgi:hypothetical protein
VNLKLRYSLPDRRLSTEFRNFKTLNFNAHKSLEGPIDMLNAYFFFQGWKFDIWLKKQKAMLTQLYVFSAMYSTAKFMISNIFDFFLLSE